MRVFSVFLITFFYVASGFSQLDSRRLSRSVSASIDNEVAPYISANGKALVFMMKDSFSGKWSVEYSRKSGGDWDRSQSVDVINKSDKLNQIGGCCLSPDGNTLFYTTKKYGGLGNSDIWQTNRSKNGVWSEPQNLGKPINSAQFDANPCISADGKYMYFMRCNSLSNSTTECCKIFVAERKGKSDWNEPVALPAPINMGCESTPRIAADGKTLFFASKRSGGLGGLDIYMSRKEGGIWSEPIAVVEMNTKMDDQYLSMAGRENLVYYSAQGNETQDLFKGKLPEKYQPNAVTILDGRVVDAVSDGTTRGVVAITDLESGEVVFRDLTDKVDGSFFAFLPAGSLYDVEVKSFEKKHLFYSTTIDTRDQTKYKYSLLKTPLAPMKSGSGAVLKGVTAENNELTTEAKLELRRVLDVVKNAQQNKVYLLVLPTQTGTVEIEMDSTLAIDDTLNEVANIQVSNEAVLKPLIEDYYKSLKVPEGKVTIEQVSATDPRVSGFVPEVEGSEPIILYLK